MLPLLAGTNQLKSKERNNVRKKKVVETVPGANRNLCAFFDDAAIK